MKNIDALLLSLNKLDPSLVLMVYPVNDGTQHFVAALYSSNACRNLFIEVGDTTAEAIKYLDKTTKKFRENWEDASKMDKANYYRLFEMGF